MSVGVRNNSLINCIETPFFCLQGCSAMVAAITLPTWQCHCHRVGPQSIWMKWMKMPDETHGKYQRETLIEALRTQLPKAFNILLFLTRGHLYGVTDPPYFHCDQGWLLLGYIVVQTWAAHGAPFTAFESVRLIVPPWEPGIGPGCCLKVLCKTRVRS